MDLDGEALGPLLGDRPLRSYPALLSTDADAQAWARAGAPDGAVVVADYQASPRGRGGLPWTVAPGAGLGFSTVLRPALSAEREGWPYIAVASALADVAGAQASITWPDEVHRGGRRAAAFGRPAAAFGVYAELGPAGVRWIVVTVLVTDARPPRGPLLRAVLAAIEGRVGEPPDAVLDRYRDRCTTLGRRVRARLVPLGPAGVEVTGEAVDCKADGALVIVTDNGRRIAVLPHHLGTLEELDSPISAQAPPRDSPD